MFCRFEVTSNCSQTCVGLDLGRHPGLPGGQALFLDLELIESTCGSVYRNCPYTPEPVTNADRYCLKTTIVQYISAYNLWSSSKADFADAANMHLKYTKYVAVSGGTMKSRTRSVYPLMGLST